MEIDYFEIMDMPEPLDGADLAALGNICWVYQFLVDKFTRLLHGPRERKDCWMQQERFAFFAKRLALNARALRRANRQFRKGEMFNFGLKVRLWVLSCALRRLKIRALIGEARIKKWQDKKQAFEAGHLKIANTTHIEKSVGGPSGSPDRKADKRTEIGNWYGLPKFPKQSYLAVIKSGKQGRENTAHMRSIGGMRRTHPVIVFWPDELISDFIDDKDKPNIDETWACGRVESEDEDVRIVRGRVSKIGAPTAREGPD